jgi:glutathione S-transferase fosA5
VNSEEKMIRGLNHLTISVKDPAVSFAFYTEILGLKPVARWPRGSYLLAGDIWVALVEDNGVRGGALPEYTHYAFDVSPDDFAALSAVIRTAGAGIWQENWTEGDSLYFLDPDGHKLEIHCSDLAARLAAAKENPWEGLEFFI